MSAGISTGFVSRAPSGLMYACSCSRSTTPVSSCSEPIGRLTAIARGESISWSWPSVRRKSARSRSSMFTKKTRDSASFSARSQTRPVLTSTPMTAQTTTSAPSTTISDAIVSPWKLASPGVSIRLILRPCQSTCVSAAPMDVARRCSSSSQSETVVPCSIEPRRLVAPPSKSSASTSDVLPVPRCPTTATLRIFPGSRAGMRCATSCWSTLWATAGGDLAPLSSRFATLAGAGGLGGHGARTAREARLEAQDRLRVQLRDARLGDPEHVADLADGQLLVVVERDDELLPLGQAGDCVAERVAELGLCQRALRVGPGRVLDGVDQRHLVARRAGDRPELVERRDRGARDVGQGVVQLFLLEPELLGELGVRRRAVQDALEVGHRALDVTGAAADGARHPVEGAELVDDRALDACNRE